MLLNDSKKEITTIDVDSGAEPKESSRVVPLSSSNDALDPIFMQERLLKHERMDTRVQGMLRFIERWHPEMDAVTLLGLG